jgi:hypothetical protein
MEKEGKEAKMMVVNGFRVNHGVGKYFREWHCRRGKSAVRRSREREGKVPLTLVPT